MTKCANVAIIGRPNAGKSTLLNAILGEHLSIVTAKPQTTRKRVLGIHSTDDTQLVFTDTPGILKPNYGMQHAMMGYVQETLAECDIICVIVDIKKAIQRESIVDPMIEKLLKTDHASTGGGSNSCCSRCEQDGRIIIASARAPSYRTSERKRDLRSICCRECKRQSRGG